MAKRKPKDADYLRSRSGHELHLLDRLVAEKDEDLGRYYVGEDRFVARALDHFDPSIFHIGPKGVGKSAILQMVRLRNAQTPAKIIDVTPDAIAISPLANAELSSPLVSDPGKYRWLFRSLWDFILSVEILAHEYPDENSFIGALKSLVRSSDERKARQLLAISGRRDDAGERSLADRVLELVKAIEISAPTHAGPISAKVELGGDKHSNSAEDSRSLLMLVNQVAKNIPALIDHKYYILVDDLDFQWSDTPLQNAFISSLFSSLAKLSISRNLKFVVALRKRIYRSLKLEDKDKYRQWICDVNWEFDDVKQIVQRRLSSVINCAEKNIWGGLFPADGFARIFSSTTGVPREAIRLAALCVRSAKHAGHKKVSSEDIGQAVLEFADEKLEDIASDWNYIYPGLDSLARRMRGWQKEFSLEKLGDLAYSVGLEVQEGKAAAREFGWLGGVWEDPKGLAEILVNCGILLLKEHQKAPAETLDNLLREQISDKSWFAFHPMIAPALRARGTLN